MDAHQQSVVNRLKTARGHLGGIVAAVEAGTYCPEVMKQLSAVQGLVEGASRAVLRRHLQTCVAEAMRQGRTEEIVDELMDTLKFDKHVFRPDAHAAAEPSPEHGVAEPSPAGAVVGAVDATPEMAARS